MPSSHTDSNYPAQNTNGTEYRMNAFDYFFYTLGRFGIIILLVGFAALCAAGCGATIASEDVISTTAYVESTPTLGSYIKEHPNLKIDIASGEQYMHNASSAADSGSISSVNNACEALSSWASSALSDYGDVPSPSLLSAFNHVYKGATLCLARDYSGAAVEISASSTGFNEATAQLESEG